MKLNLICLALLVMGLSTSAYSQSKNNQKNASSPDKPFAIKRGTNIAHWLSQSDKRGQERAAFFTRKDVDYILAAGFDHIRLAIDGEQLWVVSGKRNAEDIELLENSFK